MQWLTTSGDDHKRKQQNPAVQRTAVPGMHYCWERRLFYCYVHPRIYSYVRQLYFEEKWRLNGKLDMYRYVVCCMFYILRSIIHAIVYKRTEHILCQIILTTHSSPGLSIQKTMVLVCNRSKLNIFVLLRTVRASFRCSRRLMGWWVVGLSSFRLVLRASPNSSPYLICSFAICTRICVPRGISSNHFYIRYTSRKILVPRMSTGIILKKKLDYFEGAYDVCNQDPRWTPKPTYTPIFTHHVRSWLLGNTIPIHSCNLLMYTTLFFLYRLLPCSAFTWHGHYSRSRWQGWMDTFYSTRLSS